MPTTELSSVVRPYIHLEVIDARVNDDYDSVPGVWLAGCSSGDTRWRAVRVYMSCDGGTTFNLVAGLLRPAYMAAVGSAVLADGAGPGWDYNSAVYIEPYGGSENAFSSVTQAEVESECKNIAKLGDEIFGFATVATDGYEFILTDLLRYMRDTYNGAVSHADGENLVILDREALTFLPLPPAQIGSELVFVAAAGSQDPTALNSKLWQTITFEAGCTRPNPPAELTAEVDGSNNIDFTWVPRSRFRVDALSYVADPDDFCDGDRESYYIEIYDDTTLVRTATVHDTRAWSYTAAMQTADGYTPGGGTSVEITANFYHLGRFNKSRAATLVQSFGLEPGA